MKPKWIGTIGTIALVAGCGELHRALLIEKPTSLLEQPYPMNYPTTPTLPNKVIRVLAPEKVVILSDDYDKDFHVYKVRDPEGNIGYIIDQPGMREIRR